MSVAAPPVTAAALEAALDAVGEILPCRTAQGLVEASPDLDYVVAAWRGPRGGENFQVAHRTGVIGQVFRRWRPVFLPDAQRHPLYDPFDPEVRWELALPLVHRGRLAAVLNFEGSESLELAGAVWAQLASAVLAATGRRLPAAPPPPGEGWLAATHYLRVSRTRKSQAAASALRLARAAADGGAWVLFVGTVELPASPMYPAIEEAAAAGLSIGACVRGMCPRLDALPLSLADRGKAPSAAWRRMACGRYDFALHAH
jgi:hypothetical protein